MRDASICEIFLPEPCNFFVSFLTRPISSEFVLIRNMRIDVKGVATQLLHIVSVSHKFAGLTFF